jgi:uncharacterized membrane protein
VPASRPPAAPEATCRKASGAALVIAGLGLVIAAYLTIEHYSASATLACPESATINCAKVTTSRWSEIVGVPVALLGLLYFAAMTALLLPVAWRRPELDNVRVAGVALGSVMVLYLVYIELFRVDAICLWCTGVHICTIALLGAVLWHTSAVHAAER